MTPGPMPVPVRLMVWGLPRALSVIETDAVRVPRTVGVKVTLMLQLLPAGRELPHVLV